jgi:2-oxo-3-hexenedioate decarboxylase
MDSSLDTIAGRLVAAFDSATPLDPITAAQPGFTVAQAYDVLALIEDRRRAQGWRPVGRKIGFTNRTIWPRYGVYRPMWAHTRAHSVHHAEDGRATLPLAGFLEPRLEPEWCST